MQNYYNFCVYNKRIVIKCTWFKISCVLYYHMFVVMEMSFLWMYTTCILFIFKRKSYNIIHIYNKPTIQQKPFDHFHQLTHIYQQVFAASFKFRWVMTWDPYKRPNRRKYISFVSEKTRVTLPLKGWISMNIRFVCLYVWPFHFTTVEIASQKALFVLVSLLVFPPYFIAYIVHR